MRNKVRNPGFETPNPAADGSVLVPAGDTALRRWDVFRGDVETIDTTVLQAASGESSLDLHGTEKGGIKQLIATTPGVTYALTFQLAGNILGGEVVKDVLVDIGFTRGFFQFDTTGKTATDMGWQLNGIVFTATEEQTLLRFTSLDQESPFGAMLDDVSVQILRGPLAQTALDQDWQIG